MSLRCSVPKPLLGWDSLLWVSRSTTQGLLASSYREEAFLCVVTKMSSPVTIQSTDVFSLMLNRIFLSLVIVSEIYP